MGVQLVIYALSGDVIHSWKLLLGSMDCKRGEWAPSIRICKSLITILNYSIANTATINIIEVNVVSVIISIINVVNSNILKAANTVILVSNDISVDIIIDIKIVCVGDFAINIIIPRKCWDDNVWWPRRN